MYLDDLDRRRFCEDDLRVFREMAQNRVRSTGNRAICRLRFRVAYLGARRMLLQLCNLPREIKELSECDPERWIAASVVL
jgi:hypothetical protein